MICGLVNLQSAVWAICRSNVIVILLFYALETKESTKMMATEEEDTKFSAVMGLDVSQAAQIPKDIQKILLERFSKGCRTISFLVS